jgi:hypothetical protein
MYIFELLSSWSTSRIRLSWPCSRFRLNLFLALFHTYLSCLSWPTQYLAVCPNDSIHISHMYHPMLPVQLNSSAQVNYMAILHHIHTIAHIYITFILLFIPFFILLPLFWTGWLAQTFLVWHNNSPPLLADGDAKNGHWSQHWVLDPQKSADVRIWQLTTRISRWIIDSKELIIHKNQVMIRNNQLWVHNNPMMIRNNLEYCRSRIISWRSTIITYSFAIIIW